jgi:hypothetical protein
MQIERRFGNFNANKDWNNQANEVPPNWTHVYVEYFSFKDKKLAFLIWPELFQSREGSINGSLWGEARDFLRENINEIDKNICPGLSLGDVVDISHLGDERPIGIMDMSIIGCRRMLDPNIKWVRQVEEKFDKLLLGYMKNKHLTSRFCS